MRKLVYFTVGFCASCAVCAYLYPPALLTIGVILLILAALLFVLHKLQVKVRRLSAVILGAAMAFLWFFFYDHTVLTPARAADSKVLHFEIVATDYGYETDHGTAFEGVITHNGRTYRVQTYLDETYVIEPGTVVSGPFYLRFTANGGDREPTSHRGSGMFLILYQEAQVQISHNEDVPFYCYPAIWRRMLRDTLTAAFPADAAGFACALLLGDREGLSYKTESDLAVSGILHIIAVSGLHVTILFGLFHTLALKNRFLTFLFAVPVLVLFAAVVGFTPSVTRACIMMILMILADLVNKEYDPPTELAFSVLVMLVCNPMTVISVSFQLSVGCVTGILMFSEKIRRWMLSPGRLGEAKGKSVVARLKRWFTSSISVSLSAMVFTTPLVAYYFGMVSLVGVLTNLLTLWVISFIFYLTVGCAAIGLISMPLASVLGWVAAWPIRYVLGVAGILADFPLASVYTSSPYIVIWLVGCYVLLAIYVFTRHKHALAFACGVVITLTLALTVSWTEPLLHECCVTMVDVGQGQSVILQSNGKTYIVDCGGNSGEYAADQTASYLLGHGISRVDGIILTHYDEDHCGGIPYLLDRIDADQLFVPKTEGWESQLSLLVQGMDMPVKLVEEDILLAYGTTEITLIAPDTYISDNDSSICVLFQTENCDILITGDRGELGEMLLLYDHELPKLELLIAGHHGSSSSTGEELLAATDPETVFISVDENNRYGHPSDKLLARLEKIGCRVYRTDLHGTLIFWR